ncbi:hypothetical protein EV121DRAFT_286563 [Schizophyllum commune]|nr:hypothetical protein K525DRAFT_270979 [Schizophyllum commune Loenen D]
MCYRAVPNTLYVCGHQTPINAGEQIDCNKSNCRYSSMHPTNCPNCARTCTQWLRPAQQFVQRRESRRCPQCGN